VVVSFSESLSLNTYTLQFPPMKDNLLNFAEPVSTQFTGLQEPRPKEESSLDLVTESLRKYWYVTVLLSSLLLAGIAYKTWKQPRIYQSSIQISIELDKGSSGVDKIAALAGGGGTGGDNSSSSTRTTTIETTIQLLQSKQLLKKAVDHIPDSNLRPKVDDVLDGMKISSKQDIDILNISYSDPSPQRVVAVLKSLSEAYIDYSVQQKRAKTNSSIAFIEAQLPEARKKLDLSAQHIEQFRRQYQFADPETAVKGLTEYRQQIIGKLNEAQIVNFQAQQTQKQLSKQLGQVGLQSESSLATTVLTQDKAYQKLSEEINALDIKYNQERVRFSDENPTVTDLKKKREQLNQLLKERAQRVLKRPVSEAELSTGAISNVGGTGTSLSGNFAGKQAELETTMAAQAAQSAGLKKVYEQVELQIAQLPNLQRQYTELEREYKLQTQELTAFLQKLQELKIVNAEKIVPWTLLDPPELPRLPISPDVPRQLGLGALASLLAGVLAAVGLNKLDNRISDPDAVKDLTGLPILALIPKVGSLQPKAVQPNDTILQLSKSKNQDNAYWSFVEAIRSLALGIGFTTDQGEGPSGKIVAFTSGLPKEGKSTISFNTAATLAELGYKVLLVDGDLYKSSVRNFCTTSPVFQGVDCFGKEGLTDAITGTHRWQDLVKKAPGIKLDALFSGPRLVNSIALLNSPRLLRLMAEWRNEYDYVVLDVPPILGVSDTRLLTTMVDGLVFVVGLDVAQRQSVSRAIELISALKTTVLGVAVNQVEARYTGYHSYYDDYYSQPALSPEKVVDVRVID
jgi:polysaccharide biosynthesis transport protein